MKERNILRIEVTTTAKARLTECSQRTGLTQVAMCSRLVEWFAIQPETIQRLMLDHIPAAVRKDVTRLVLKNLGKTEKAPVPPEILAP